MSDATQPAATESAEQALARAQAAGRAKRMHEAMGICHDVLATAPDSAAALALLGTLQAQNQQLEEGIALLERAVARDATVPGWHANLCALYRLAGRPADALRAGLQAVRLNAGVPQFLVNLALAQIDLDERDQATACLLRAIGIAPDDASAHLALGQVLLAAGQMQPGWIEYEWRNKTEAARGTLPRITSAHWNGMRLKGGRILLVGDQGYGDTIQFARYIPMVAERCDEVILGCSAELAPLLEKIPGIGRCLSNWAEVPGHAAHCRLSSLPWLFATDLDTIPGPHPYLHAEPGRVADWAARLGPRSGGRPRVGLAWTGRPTHPNDRRRSLRLAQLLPLADMADVEFVCLQKPLPDADRDAVARFRGMTDLSAQLADFADTAALIANLDLLVSVDTGVGHLAGALGVPAWLLLGRACDWRWLTDRDDTPWYPRTRLFRQRHPGAWDAPIAAAASALAAFAAEARAPVHA